MGLFDFFKSTPDYIIDDVLFYGGGLSLPGNAKFSTDVEWGSYYLYPRLYLTVNRPCDVQWRVVIIQPDGKKLQGSGQPEGITTDYETKLEKTGKILLTCPGFGNKVDIPYIIGGCWHWILCDMNDNILISKTFYIKTPDDNASENAYMHILDIEFATGREGPYLPADRLKPDSSAQYLYARVDYAGIMGSIETDVDFDIEIVRPDGKTGRFAARAHVNPGGGKFDINGYGNDKGTWYIEGDYRYKINYRGKTLFTKQFTVAESLADRCYLEDVEVEWGQDVDMQQIYAHLYEGKKPPQTLDLGRIYTIWIKARNSAPSEQTVYLKITDDDGKVLRINHDVPEGYTTEGKIKISTGTGLFCRILLSNFEFLVNMVGVHTYKYSLWCENRRGQMKCLYAGKKVLV